MTKLEFLEKLKSEISEEEALLLKSGNELFISSYNRQAMVQMLEDNNLWTGQVDECRAEMLRKVTNDYLAVYLADKPDAWKWIFLTCAYNSFICEIPMHPKEMVKFQTKLVNGRTVYMCPAKNPDPNTNCDFCVCEGIE